jgi:hypothetical protein
MVAVLGGKDVGDVMRMNVVQIICTHACKWKSMSEAIPGMG